MKPYRKPPIEQREVELDDERKREAKRKYHTIVADPPWPTGRFGNFGDRHKDRPRAAALPYRQMSVEEIAGLMSEVDLLRTAIDDHAHLYLWTTTRFLREAFAVLEAWDFDYSTTLTWVKRPMGERMGWAFHPSTEFVLFGHRGDCRPLMKWPQSHFEAKRPYRSDGKPLHSAKPDSFLDLVEQVSPGPYLELFARRARFGWDYWGDESLQTVDLEGAA